jgi:hypothetical protein
VEVKSLPVRPSCCNCLETWDMYLPTARANQVYLLTRYSSRAQPVTVLSCRGALRLKKKMEAYIMLLRYALFVH